MIHAPDAEVGPATQAEVVARDPRPLVSVVMPCYREPIPIIRRSLDSICAQTYSNLEIVAVVDDPENEAVVRFLRGRSEVDPRIRVVLNPCHLGVWPSYNHGVREARGEIIAIQDDDDVSTPARLERLTAFLLAHPEVGVVGSGVVYVDEASGRTMMTRIYPQDVAAAIRRYSPLAHPTTVRWAHLFRTHGDYDESSAYRHAADYELWCRWHSGGVRMANIPEIHYRYYQSDRNFKARNVKAILRDTVTIKRRYARRLGFGVGDYLWLAIEVLATALPARVVVTAFYSVNRQRSSSLTDGEGGRVSSTTGREYTRLLQGQGSRWKSILNVQRPYRWNIRRLAPGFVLDLGCGIGRNLAHLDGHGVGIDHNQHSVAVARARGLEAYTPEEFADSRWNRPGAVDSLLCAHVLEHMRMDEATKLLADHLPLVKSRGRVIVIVPQAAGFKSDASHVQYLGPPQLAEVTRALPLVLERMYSFPFPAWAGRVFRYNETVALYRIRGDAGRR